ncbi:hypothetical protein ACP8HZ_05780 [Francisella noatunensis]
MKKIILKIAPPKYLSGAVLTLAFAPFRIDVLAVVALVAFFYLLNRSVRIRDAFFTSVLFGIGFFGTSISWVYISIHLFYQNQVATELSDAIALIILLSFLHIIPFGIFSHILTRKANNFSQAINLSCIVDTI